MEENMSYGPVSNRTQPAQEPVYEEPDAKTDKEIQIGGNIAYGHIRQ